MAKKMGWQLDKMPEKMIAMATFHGEILRKISKDPVVYNRITTAGAKLVSKYFEAYVDSIARIDPYRYHHIYEFNKTGNKSSRLFRSEVKDGRISYSFIDSTMPNNNGQVFAKKAFVMESGNPLTIIPSKATKLVFEVDGEMIFTNSVFVKNPGGQYVKGAFQTLFNEFFNSQLPNKALREFGFFDAIEEGIRDGINKVAPSISAGQVNNAAQKAAQAAYGVAERVERSGNRL